MNILFSLIALSVLTLPPAPALDKEKVDPFNVISAQLDGPQRKLSLTLKILTDVRLDELILTDPDNRTFRVNPERNVLRAGMQPTYEFLVESGDNFRIGKFRLLVRGQMTSSNLTLTHEVEFEAH